MDSQQSPTTPGYSVLLTQQREEVGSVPQGSDTLEVEQQCSQSRTQSQNVVSVCKYRTGEVVRSSKHNLLHMILLTRRVVLLGSMHAQLLFDLLHIYPILYIAMGLYIYI